MKKFFLIILLATALNFSYQPSISVPFEKHRITTAVSSEDDLATADVLRESSQRKSVIRASVYMEVLLREIRYSRAFDSS